MARANDLADGSSPTRGARAWLLLAAWAVAAMIIVIARAPAYWIIVPCVVASVISYRTGPAKTWMLYAGVACAITVAFVWTSAMFTYSLDLATR